MDPARMGADRKSKQAVGMSRAHAFITRLCASPCCVPLTIGASLLLCLPALDGGLLADDFIHRRILTGQDEMSIPGQSWLTLFHFASPEHNAALLAEGSLPWWSHPQLSIAFFRPLSALTHMADFALFPDAPALMHLHSLLWSAAGLTALWLLYRETFQQTTAATVALLFYALEPTRATAVTWLANRNTLIALCFSALSISVYLRNTRPSPWPRWLSPALLGLAVLASEGAVAGLAYLLAAACFLDDRPRKKALLGLVPHALLALGVLLVGHWQSHGVVGSAAYLDPRNDLVAFLAAAPQRAATMLAASLNGPAADASQFYELMLPGLSATVRWAIVLWIALWAAVLWRLVRRSKTARFFAAGAVLSLLPAAAAVPSDRLLGWVSIGVVALCAELLESVLSRRPEPRRIEKLAVCAFVVARVVFGPVVLHAQVKNLEQAGHLQHLANDAIPATDDIRDKVAVFVNVPDDPMVSFLPAMRAATGTPRPAAVRRLTAGFSPVAIRRTAQRTVEILQPHGFLQRNIQQLTRSIAAAPFNAGDRLAVRGMSIKILEVLPDGRPLRVAFTFDEGLNRGRYLFRAFRDGDYVPFTLPVVGSCVELPAPSFLALYLGRDHPLVHVVNHLHPHKSLHLCGESEPAIVSHTRTPHGLQGSADHHRASVHAAFR